jgi:hypothetical protein
MNGKFCCMVAVPLSSGYGSCWPNFPVACPAYSEPPGFSERQLYPRKPPFGIATSPLTPVTVRPGGGTPPLSPGVARSRTFPVRASRTPGVAPSSTRAACIDRSMDGSDAQVHNSMSHIILEL